jgi:hypothetical protein
MEKGKTDGARKRICHPERVFCAKDLNVNISINEKQRAGSLCFHFLFSIFQFLNRREVQILIIEAEVG